MILELNSIAGVMKAMTEFVKWVINTTYVMLISLSSMDNAISQSIIQLINHSINLSVCLSVYLAVYLSMYHVSRPAPGGCGV